MNCKIDMCADLSRSRGAVQKIKRCAQEIKSLEQHVLQTRLFVFQMYPHFVPALSCIQNGKGQLSSGP